MYRRHFFAFLLWSLPILNEGKICPGFCVPQDMCKSDGGQVVGLCVNGRVCCDVSHKLNRSTCGSVVNSWDRDKPIQFVSPQYPGHSSGSLICQFELKLDKSIVGVKLDLDRFELQSNSVSQGDGQQDQKCDADMFFIKGFSDWMTNPICGHLNGFSILIDVDSSEYPGRKLILLFIMSSKEYRWKIKIHKILVTKLKKSEICLRTRLSKLSKDGNLSTKLAPSKPTKFLSLREPETYQHRWKWDVDIVTRASPTYKIPCHKNQNNSEPYPFLHKLCSGTILDERHVLTTANCFSKSRPHALSDLAILTSAFCPVDSRNPEDHYLKVESVFLHFNYISSIIHNDMAVLRTKKPIKFGELDQPISIFGGKSRYLAFSSKKPLQGSSIRVPEALVVTAENASDCSSAQALHINLTPALLKEYTHSNKYTNLMANWICFPGQLSAGDLECPTDLSSLQGASLVGVAESGERVKLVGIFNHAIPIAHQLHQSKLYVSTNETNSANAYIYFTKIEFFHKFILMALS